MAVLIRDVCNLFERYGWSYHQHDDQTLFVSFRGKSRDFTLGARLDDNWLTLTIVTDLPEFPPERQTEVYRHLLGLNTQISIARFAINSDSEIILTADLSGHKKLNYDVFATTVDALSFYADETYPLLYKLITSEEPPKQGSNQDERS